MAREYFCAYHSFLESLTPFGDAECGRLFRACLTYSMSGEEPELCGNERFIWPTLKQTIDRDVAAYNAKCEQNRANASGGTRPQANASGGSQEKEKDKEEGDKSPTTTPVMDYSSVVKEIVNAWNSLGLQQIKKISNPSTRYNSLKARIREYSPEDVLTAIEKVRSSPFLTGNNSRGWVITFDWFIKPNNFPKVLEGNYDARATSGGKTNNIFLEIAEERAYDGK